MRSIFGYTEHRIFRTEKYPRMGMKHAYNQHIAYVKQVCPADQLLTFNCEEGWGPLCKFLQLLTPTSPFPHKNIGGKVIEELLLPSATFQRIRREVAFGITITCMMGFGTWLLFRHGLTPSQCLNAVKQMFMIS